MKTIIITGASGFIARRLAETLKHNGMRTVGTSRAESSIPGFDRVYRARLGESLHPLLVEEKPDAVIHTALDPAPDSFTVNVKGTALWLDESASAGVGLQILLSSLSADESALADYGRAKYALEQKFIASGQVVFRLGVVVGDGGMFTRMVDSARRTPIIPLINGGKQPVYVLGIDFLCLALRDTILINGNGLRGQAWNIQQPQPFTLREVMETINRVYGFHRALFPLPVGPILWALALVEKIPGLKLPISTTNVKGLIQSQGKAFDSDFSRFGYNAVPLETLVQAAHE